MTEISNMNLPISLYVANDILGSLVAPTNQDNKYYNFGMPMPGRNMNLGDYRYGFGGQEKDDEIAGLGNSYTAEFWQYDPRLGRRWNPDPVRVAWESPYAAFRNNPIVLNDPNGDCPDCPEGTHTVEKGDTYWGLAKNSNGAYTVDDLKAWNPGVDPTKLQIGQTINTANPNAATASSSSTSTTNTPSLIDPISIDPVVADNTRVVNPLIIDGGGEGTSSSSGSGADILTIAQNINGTLGIMQGATQQSLEATQTIQALQEGRFIASYNGKTYRWKLGFQGNQHISSEVVAAEKAAFQGGTKIKVFNAVKVAGKVVNVAGIALTAYQIYDEGEITAETGADLVFGAIAFIPGGGWVVSGAYFLGKAMYQSSKASGYEFDRTRDLQGGGLCFVEGTMILFFDGSNKPIEDVVVGDSVKTYDLQNNLLEDNPVLKIDTSIQEKFVQITFSNGVINTNTPSHPYYVKGKGWCSYDPQDTKKKYGLTVEGLSEGDTCLFYKGGQMTEITVSQIKEVTKPQMTYNLSDVANNNNFFANGILVHNKYVPADVLDEEGMEMIMETINQLEDERKNE